MKFLTGLFVLAACLQPYVVWGGAAAASAAAASAANSDNNAAAAASAAAAAVGGSGAGGGSAAASSAASAASAGNGAGGGSTAASSAATATSSSRAHVGCKCDNVYNPVCGTNGLTYANKCILECISANNVANNYPPIGVHRRGECPRKSCVCTKEYKPVCGTDGNTYANKCFFDCENSRRDSIGLRRIIIDYYGPCKKHVCSCSNAIIPVCGTDGKTYRNVCILQCYSRRNEAEGKKPIYVKCGGACPTENCNCKIVDDPVCASDKNTYKNYCVLQCQNRRRDALGLSPLAALYRGKCLNCICPAVYAPVCANNGVTYGNECILDCENRRRASLRPPLPPLVVNCRCACSCKCELKYDPVCTKDNRTFNNMCWLKCENIRRRDVGLPPLYFQHYGRCACNCNYCPNNYDPVCGSDGRTYYNLCYLNCNRSCYYDPHNPLQRVRCH